MNNNPPPKSLVPAVSLSMETTPALLVGGRPAALSSNPDAWGMLRSFRRRWTLALALGVTLAVVAGGGAWLILPAAKYAATATLYVATTPHRIIFETRENATDYRTYQKTQTTLLKDRKVLSHALADPKVAALPTVREQEDPEDWLQQQLKADFPGGAEVLQVTLSGDHPDDLAVIVNTVTKSYMTLVVDDEERKRVNRLDELRKLREKYDNELKAKRKSLRETAATVGVSNEKALALTQTYKSEHLATIQRDRMAAQSDILRAKARLSVVEARRQAPAEPLPPLGAASEPATGRNADFDLAVEQDPRVVERRQALKSATTRYNDMARLSRLGSDPVVKRALGAKDSAAKELADARAAVAAELTAALEQRGNGGADGGTVEGSNEPEVIRGRIAELEAYKASLDSDFEAVLKEVKTFSEGSLDLENEREEIAIASEVARKVGSEVEAVQVELGAPARVTLWSPAKVPSRKDDTKRIKFGAAAAAGGFVFALLGVSYWDFIARRVAGVDQVVNGLGIRLVGTLPTVDAKSQHAGDRKQAERDVRLVESIDAMRAVLLHSSRAERTRLLMITSAVQGEGKTSLACHLAGSLARAGRRTLLLDCDLRRPTCHRLFGTPPDPGLCEYLRGEAELDDVVRETPTPRLLFMPAGLCDDRAVSALAQDVLRDLFERLRERFDFIVIDSAPVLPVADSLLVAQAVDAVIFSVMREFSRLPEVYSAYERLNSLGVKVMGAVVANVPGSAPAYYGSVDVA